jgi:putative membrane protein
MKSVSYKIHQKDILTLTTVRDPVDPALQLALERTRLAVERTALALERAHLSWIRTAITLIVCGFGIDEGMQIFLSQRILLKKIFIIQMNLAGLAMIVAGVTLTVSEGIGYMRRYYQLAEMRNLKRSYPSAGLVLSVLIVGLGITFIYLVFSLILY